MQAAISRACRSWYHKSVFTIQKSGAAEQTINKSRFLAWAAHCDSEQQVGAFLRAIAAQHASASHLAYAFRIKTADGIIPRFSDAGEPSGTAGKPILQMLEGRDLINTAVGVIRYYGGVNLGTGGLARAYGGTAKMALEAASSMLFIEMKELNLTVAYKQLDELTRLVMQARGEVLDKQFDSAVQVKLRLPAQEIMQFQTRFG
jgi:uncharacterized YigZ family protein